MAGAIDNQSLATQRAVLSVLRLLRPASVKNRDAIRVGRIFDGGYVMVDDFDNIDAAYSLGIEREVSWDRQIADYGIDIYQYDHTIDGLPEANERFHWSKLGISDRPRPEENLDTLENIVEANGHGRSELLLKCDIEGHEYGMLSSTPSSLLQCFRQIVMEVHGFERLSNLDHAKRVYNAFANLTENHQVVHVHANNHAPYTILGGTAVPSVMEITLVRRNSYEFEPCTTTFPTPLDAPCHPHTVDYYLGSFSF